MIPAFEGRGLGGGRGGSFPFCAADTDSWVPHSTKFAEYARRRSLLAHIDQTAMYGKTVRETIWRLRDIIRTEEIQRFLRSRHLLSSCRNASLEGYATADFLNKNVT